MSKIVERFVRENNKGIANLFNYANGTGGELRNQIFIGMEIKYIVSQVGQTWILEVTDISRMLSGFINSVLFID